MKFEITEVKTELVEVKKEIKHEVNIDISLHDLLLMFKFIGKSSQDERENLGMTETESEDIGKIYRGIYKQIKQYEGNVLSSYYFK